MIGMTVVFDIVAGLRCGSFVVRPLQRITRPAVKTLIEVYCEALWPAAHPKQIPMGNCVAGVLKCGLTSLS
jgi:hypothetical protein